MKTLLIRTDQSIKDALNQISISGEKCLIVVDEKDKFLGTLSDGDVRNAILNGKKMNESIQTVYNQNATHFLDGKYSMKETKDIFIKKKFDIIPVIDQYGKVIEILSWAGIFGDGNKKQGQSLNVPVVVMAGGRGIRLEPFTKVLPKPLIPVHEKPIIEHIIERFNELGCAKFYITVNYKSKIIKAYFEELEPNYKVQFVDEQEPLGTAGSLRNLDGKFDQPFFVTNCDIIVKTDYVNLYEFHKKGGYDVTLVASAKEYIIPYGTCELNLEGHLSHINEKPKYDFLINTGLYILNPDILSLIPENTFYHITHLIEDAKNKNKKIGVFPIDDEAWIDVGLWTEYKKVMDKL